jgi:hypothetical protein
LGVAVTGAGAVFACGGGHDFNSSDPGATGGAAGDSELSGGGGKGPMAGKTGGGTSSTSNSGAPDDGGRPPIAVGGEPTGTAGEGGAPTATPECPDGYSDWLSSSFSFPDGDVIGATDFPPMPWGQTGALKIDTGKLTGTGTAIVSQGTAFPYAGSRLRFRARFTDSNQQVTAAFDAAKDGTGGVRVTLDAAGKLTLTEGKIVVATANVPPLETGVDWFVETTFKATDADVVLSRNNYATEKSATSSFLLSTDALKVTAAGTKAAAVLTSTAGIAPALDELSFARCGAEPPELTPLFADSFDRADSAMIGKADFPANATWIASSASATLANGGLQVTGLATAHVPLATVPADGVRIRTTVRSVGDFLWADVSYNGGSSDVDDIFKVPGFWVWNEPTTVYTDIFGGLTTETKNPGKSLTAKTNYFVELDRDDPIATMIVRKTSFTGEIVLVVNQTGLSTAQNVGQFLWLGTESGVQTTLFDDIRVDHSTCPNALYRWGLNLGVRSA